MQAPRYQKRLPRCVDGYGQAHGGNDFGQPRWEDDDGSDEKLWAIDDVNRVFNAGRKFRRGSIFPHRRLVGFDQDPFAVSCYMQQRLGNIFSIIRPRGLNMFMSPPVERSTK